jgi:WD40 repeat protein
MPARTITTDADVQAVAFTKDGTGLAGTGADSKVRIWDAQSGVLRQTIPLSVDERLAALPSGAGVMVVAGKDGGVELRELETGKPSTRFAPRGKPVPRRLALASDHTAMAGSGADSLMRVWETSGQERFAVSAGIGGTSALAFSPDAKFLAAGSYDTDVRVWSTRNGELVRHIDEILVSTFAMAFTPDGKYLLTGGVDRILYFWDTGSWKVARKLTGQPEMISAIAVAPNGRMIATGGMSEFTVERPVKVLLWDATTGARAGSFDAPHMVSTLAFSPDGKALAAACRRTVHLWDIGATA